MYVTIKKKLNLTKTFLDFAFSPDTEEDIILKKDIVNSVEYIYRCERCFDEFAKWTYNYDWLKKSEEEETYFIPEKENVKHFMEEIKKYEKVGHSLNDALIKVKIKNLPKYQYGVFRKDLFDVYENNKKRNLGFVSLVSLNENKIIEYGNKEYNNGAPVLRDIKEEDKYLYLAVWTFKLFNNINEVFHSINLTPWTANRYDVLFYSSYNFINIYLKKYSQKLILIKNIKIFNSAFLHLCRDCYKKLNHPDCYVDCKTSSVQTSKNSSNKEDKYWWCWDCGKLATFHFVGRPLNIKYTYLCESCYFDLAEPKNYMKMGKPNFNPGFLGMNEIIANSNLLIGLNYCSKCAKYYASYKLF